MLTGLLTLAISMISLGSEVSAHELPRERTVLVEISPSSVEAMVVYQEPPGRRISLLFARFDFDGDKKLRGAEAEAAGSSWIPYAMQGLEIRVDGETPDRKLERIKFRSEHNGAISSAILLSWDVGPLEEDGERKVTVARKSDAADFETMITFQVESDLRFVATPRDAAGTRAGPYPIRPGDSLSTLTRRKEDEFDLPTRPP